MLSTMSDNFRYELIFLLPLNKKLTVAYHTRSSFYSEHLSDILGVVWKSLLRTFGRYKEAADENLVPII